MTRNEFLDLMASYGADFSRWPETRRHEAERFLAKADEATRHAYEAENAFDDFISPEMNDPVVPIRLEEQILGTAPMSGVGRARLRRHWFGRWGRLKTPHWATAGLLSLSLVGGVGAGYASTVTESDSMAEATMMAYAASAENGMYEAWSLNDGKE